MNKFYVLNNSRDNSLFYKNSMLDTRSTNESKRFISRRSAEKFLKSNKLSENYSVKLLVPKVIKESVDKKDIIEEIESAVDDTKDILETTIDLIETYHGSLNEDVLNCYNIDDILDKLKKVKSYMSCITFSPSFDNSLSADPNKDLSSDTNFTGSGDNDAQ